MQPSTQTLRATIRRLRIVHMLRQAPLVEAAERMRARARDLAALMVERDACARRLAGQRATFLALSPRLGAARAAPTRAQTLAAQQALRGAILASLDEDQAHVAAFDARAQPLRAAEAAAYADLQRLLSADLALRALLDRTARHLRGRLERRDDARLLSLFAASVTASAHRPKLRP